MSHDVIPASGRQLQISAHGYEAVIASVGASLRTLRYRGRDLVVPFEANELRPAYRGATLAPWPNRVIDGRYTFGGSEQQLPLTEPARSHALHGLVAWAEFSDREIADDRIAITTVIEPQAGYPHRVEVQVEYRLDADGLTQTVTARNLGVAPAPWGTGPHPYLVAGKGRVNDWTLELPATEVLTVTEDRLIPVAVEGVDRQRAFDFRVPRAIDDTFIDHAFTGLPEGAVTLHVRAADGAGVGMSWDDACPWVQVHTADNSDQPSVDRIGLAVEPMTCPPDAFNSAVDLIVLAPGEEARAHWRIFAL